VEWVEKSAARGEPAEFDAAGRLTVAAELCWSFSPDRRL